MKNKVTKYGMMIVAAVLLVAMVFAGAASADTWDGTSVDTSWYVGNESKNVFYIYTAAQLAGLAKLVNDETTDFLDDTIYLENDIDLADYPWKPIATTSVDERYFYGSFNGNNHTISNLNVSSADRHLGLFGSIGADREYIPELGMVLCNVNIDGAKIIRQTILLNGYIGALVGDCSASIMNCHVTNLSMVVGTTVKDASASWIGGLVGESHGPIKNCSVTRGSMPGIIMGMSSKNYQTRDVGGLAGVAHETVENCYSDCDVTGSSYVGGLIGRSLASVRNCYATGNVTGEGVDDYGMSNGERVGGLIGEAGRYSSEPVIRNCYATGFVNGTGERVGGLIGSVAISSGNDEIDVIHCNASGDVIGKNLVGGLIGKSPDGYVSDCHATGNVSYHDTKIGQILGTRGNRIGGLIGDTSHYILNSYATGNVNGYDYVGGLVGYTGSAYNCSIFDSYATGKVSGYDYVGGLAGHTDDNILRCYATGNVSGHTQTGGLIGYAARGSVFNSKTIGDCYATGNVSGGTVIGWEMTGGLIGLANVHVINCSATGNVYGDKYVGGLIGRSYLPGLTLDIDQTSASGDVYGYEYVGGLIGEADDQVSNSHASGDVFGSRSAQYLGGLIGKSEVVIKCYATGNVTYEEPLRSASKDSRYSGGLVGYADGKVDNCYATGNVIGCAWESGGLIGYVNGDLSNCYATGYVVGASEIGGLVGHTSHKILHCYATGNVTSTSGDLPPLVPELTKYYCPSCVGGLAGQSDKVTECYATGNVSGYMYVGGLVGFSGGEVTHCYATGGVNGTQYVGGISGCVDNHVSQCAALNRYIIATPNLDTDPEKVGSIFGYRTSKSLYAKNCADWVRINRTGFDGADAPTRFNSYAIWNRFLESYTVWSYLSFDTSVWKANSGNDVFEMPVLKAFSGYDTTSDAIHLKPEIIVTFDPKGGIVSPTSKEVRYHQSYGTLPTPYNATSFFQGWYLNTDCTGDAVTESSIVNNPSNHFLYAKWSQEAIVIANTNINFGTKEYGTPVAPITDAINTTVVGNISLIFPIAGTTNFTFTNDTSVLSGEVLLPKNVIYMFNITPEQNLSAGFYSADIALKYNDSVSESTFGNLSVTYSVLAAGVKDDPIVEVPDLPLVYTVAAATDYSGIEIIGVDGAENLTIDGGSSAADGIAVITIPGSKDNTALKVTNVYNTSTTIGKPSFARKATSIVTAEYPEKELSNGGSYTTIINMTHVSTNLPVLSGQFNDTLSDILNEETETEAIAMVSSINDDAGLVSMNKLIHENGIGISFEIAKSKISDISMVEAYHIEGTNITGTFMNITNASSDTYLVNVTGSSFSTYVVAVHPQTTDPTPTSTPSSSSRNPGYTVILPEELCEVSFEMNGHGTQVINQSVSFGNSVDEPYPAPTADGYTFTGWYSDRSLTSKYVFSTPVTDNIKLYAGWATNLPNTPTSNPTTWPTTQPTQSSPAPVIGIIAGLGAVALLLRLRK